MFDLNGNAVSGHNLLGASVTPCYDISGNPLEGYSVHEQLDVGNAFVGEDWRNNARTAYNQMRTVYDNTPNSVPFFINTDQHGRSIKLCRFIHNIDIIDLANINLGDTFNLVQMQTDQQGIVNYIGVVGNHDAYTPDATIAEGEILNNATLKKYFTTSMEKVVADNADTAYYKALDRKHNVKYLVMCPYYMNEDGSRNGVQVRTNQMQWLIDELTANDGFDSVVLMHQLWTDLCIHRDGTLQTWADAPVILQNMWEMLKDRRNGRSGTIADSDGVSHSYDFTNCQTRLLCSLHGHTHEELYQTEKNMTQYAADWLGNNFTCTFGLIDRNNNRLKVWVFNKNSVQDMFEMNI